MCDLQAAKAQRRGGGSEVEEMRQAARHVLLTSETVVKSVAAERREAPSVRLQVRGSKRYSRSDVKVVLTIVGASRCTLSCLVAACKLSLLPPCARCLV